MKIRRLAGLFHISRYRSLRKAFRNPLWALVASAGMLKKTFMLKTNSGSVITVNRDDLPVWGEYFTSKTCKVSIADGLFHVVPNNARFPPYYIKGGCQCLTFKPERWNKNAYRAPFFRELELGEKSVYSQHGEDGVIEALLRHIPVTRKYIVEFGAYDGITMSNSRYLIQNKDWSALLIELDRRFYRRLAALYRNKDKVITLRAAVTPANINRLFKQAEVPRDFEILSIDIDGPDYYVWKGLTDFQPLIVIIEYNSSIPPDREYVVGQSEATTLGGTSREGASILSLYKLGKKKGYNLIYCELTGGNLFFIHESCKQYLDYIELTPSELYQTPQFGVLSGGVAPNGRGYV